MDALDTQIMEILKGNGRAKFVDIGKTLGLSEGAVRRRVRNLVQAGVIKKFTIETQSGAEGIVMIKTNPAFTREVSQELKSLTEKVFEVSGDFDIAVFISAAGIEGLNRKVDEIRRLPHVQDTNTLMKLTGV